MNDSTKLLFELRRFRALRGVQRGSSLEDAHRAISPGLFPAPKSCYDGMTAVRSAPSRWFFLAQLAGVARLGCREVLR